MSEAAAPRFAIAVGRFYEDLAERLVAGAQRAFAGPAASEADVFDVPGAFELPLAAAYLTATAATPAWPASARSSAARPTTTTTCAPRRPAASRTSSCAPACPCAFGVLTVENMDQALARTGGGKRDQGEHAAEAVLALAALRRDLGI